MGVGRWQLQALPVVTVPTTVLLPRRKTGCTRAQGSTRGLGVVRKLPVTSPQGARRLQRVREGHGRGWWLLLEEAEPEFGTLTSSWPGLPL